MAVTSNPTNLGQGAGKSWGLQAKLAEGILVIPRSRSIAVSGGEQAEVHFKGGCCVAVTL